MDTDVRYEVTLTVTRPVRYDHDDPIEEQEAWAVSADAKRELEREVLRALRKVDGVLNTIRRISEAQASRPAPPLYLAWLIELGCNPPEYWTGRRESGCEFLPNAHDALRFARFEDAEVVRCHIVDSKIRLGCKSVQHGFSAPPAAHAASTE